MHKAKYLIFSALCKEIFCYNTVQHKAKYCPRIAAVSRTQKRHKKSAFPLPLTYDIDISALLEVVKVLFIDLTC